MEKYEFSTFSPSRNFTLFLHGCLPHPDKAARLCRQAMGEGGLRVEQSAIADIPGQAFFMAGGEFCVNACRAFGALIHWKEGRSGKMGEYEISASGLGGKARLHSRGSAPSWRVRADFSADGFTFANYSGGARLAEIAGISHLLIECEQFPPKEAMPALARRYSLEYSLDSRPAHGIVWHIREGKNFKIMPFVSVPAAGTAMLESSCGSASLALALCLGRGMEKIVQPCGEILLAGQRGGIASIAGNVDLIAYGSIWLDG